MRSQRAEEVIALVADIATKTVSVGGRLFHAALHRMAESLHRRDLPVASDRHLTGRKNAVLHVALGAIHQRLHLVRIETYFGRDYRQRIFPRASGTLL